MMTEEQISANKTRFLSLLSVVDRDGSKELIEWLNASDFFTAPASTKFHGNYSGGLCEHSLNVYNNLKMLIDIYLPDEEVPDDTVAVCALLHDLCKVHCYKPGTRNVKENGSWVSKATWEFDERFPAGDHADKSIIIIQQFMKLTADEILAIRAHMGGFDTAVKGNGGQFVSKIFERSKLALLLHLADMASSYLFEERN